MWISARVNALGGFKIARYFLKMIDTEVWAYSWFTTDQQEVRPDVLPIEVAGLAD